MRTPSFAELARQSDNELRARLDDDDSSVRLHAAWQLGLRLGAEVLPDLVPRLDLEPAAGVRRHLMVVIAGHGRREVLACFAQLDPDPLVRATAVGYLSRLLNPDDAELYALVQSLVTHEQADIRRMVLEGLRPDAPAQLHAAVRERLSDDSAPVRWAAMDRRRDVLGGVGPVIDEVAAIGRERVLDALEWAADRDDEVAWDEVGAHLRRLGRRSAKAGAAMFADRPDAAPIAYWLECMARPIQLEQSDRTTCIRVVGALVTALDASGWEGLTEHERQRVTGLIQRTRSAMVARSDSYYIKCLSQGEDYSSLSSQRPLVYLHGKLLQHHPFRDRWLP